MSPEDDDLDLVAISLPRPLAGAVARGHVRCVNLEEFSRVLPRGGLLVVIHAGPTWVPGDAEALRAPRKSFVPEDPDGPPAWPDCPLGAAQHPQGLVGVGLLHTLTWAPANHAVLELLGDLEGDADGPWVLGLDYMVTFKTPAPCLGYPRPFELPDALAAKIISAWKDRPPEAPAAPPEDWRPDAGSGDLP